MARPKPLSAHDVLAYLDRLRLAHAAYLSIFGTEKVLTFMGTASRSGQAPAMAIARVLGVEAPPDGGVRIRLRGRLPRPPAEDERIAVSLSDPDQFLGYQVKGPSLTDASQAARLYEDRGAETVVTGRQVFTVHPSDYTTRFFEEVPFRDVAALAERLRFAAVAVGVQANVSPRFVFHQETDGSTVSLFHGDSALNKTHLNLQTNARETRLVVDLETLSGLVLEGTVAPFTEEEHPEAARAVIAAFASAGIGAPRRLYRLVAERWAWTSAER